MPGGGTELSTFCGNCGNSIGDQDRFCPACGARAAGHAGIPVPVVGVGPAKTSAKAILSLIFGIFIFFFPFSVVAIILGHLSLSEIKKSADRLAGKGSATAGLVLGYTGVAGLLIMLILAAIAIPGFVRSRIAANESSAVGSVRLIANAQVSYSESYPETGYACSLSALGDSQMIDGVLASGQKDGYRFEITGCEAQGSGGPKTKYQIVAYPIAVNQSGKRTFCSDESEVIKKHTGGSPQNCLEKGVVLR